VFGALSALSLQIPRRAIDLGMTFGAGVPHVAVEFDLIEEVAG
jgi:hypothetical protein